MKNIMISSFFIILLSCKNDSINTKLENNNQIQARSSFKVDIDSNSYWVSLSYLNSLDSITSICDCWKNNKFHFLSFNNQKMELYLKSNLFHFGHDSDLIIPISEMDKSSNYTTTNNNWQLPIVEFTLPENDTLILKHEGNELQFIRKSYLTSENKEQPKHIFFTDQLHKLNSKLLLKYDVIDKENSSKNLITSKKLNQLIQNGHVNAHCSDDYHLDGITIKNDSIRYFKVQFKDDKISLFESENGRNKGEKYNLDTLPKQVMMISKNKKSVIK